MASQPASGASRVEISSYIRGYHAYVDVWQPAIDECVLLVREETNANDSNAVAAILANGTVVGHVPFNLAPLFSQFLRRNCNKGTAKVTGERVNRGAGYGLEIPCTYYLYGPSSYTESILQERNYPNIHMVDYD